MLDREHDGVVVLGKRKKGKTTLLDQILEGETRVVLYDGKGDLTQPVEIECGSFPQYGLPIKGVFRGYVKSDNKPAEELEWAAYVAAQLGRCILFVDELADALEGEDPGQWFKWVTRMGRKRDVRFLYATQRPQEVPRMVTSQAADWYLFQTNEPNELQYIRQSISHEASLLVKDLPRGQALHVRDGKPYAIMKTRNPNIK